MRDLMRQNARHLALGLGLHQQAGVDENEPAGKSKGVDRVVVHDLELERHLRVGVPNQVLTDAVDVLGNDGVADHLRRPLDFVGIRLAEGDLLFERIEVDLAVDIALTDGLDVVLLLLFLLGPVILREEQSRESQDQHDDEKPLASIHDRSSPSAHPAHRLHGPPSL